MHIRSTALALTLCTMTLGGSLFGSGGPLAVAVAEAQTQADEPVFFDDLAPYGIWFQHPVHGAVWQPAEIDGRWRPYQGGRWLCSRQWGWYFEANQPWGDIVFHYGRWRFDEASGWLWVPGTQWGPGWVAWRAGQRSIGWSPLGPKEAIETDSAYWSFCDDERFVAPEVLDLADVVYDRRKSRTVWGTTRTLDRTVLSRPANLALDPRDIERETHIYVRPREIAYRVAHDRDDQPIGWNPREFGTSVTLKIQPVRAHWDDQPSPYVTQRLLIDVRSGRLREDDPYATSQVSAFAERGLFRFQDQGQQAIVERLPAGTEPLPHRRRPMASVSAPRAQIGVEILHAVRTQGVDIAGRTLPQPVEPQAQPVVKFKSPDDLTARPELVGIPAINRYLPSGDRLPGQIKASGVLLLSEPALKLTLPVPTSVPLQTETPPDQPAKPVPRVIPLPNGRHPPPVSPVPVEPRLAAPDGKTVPGTPVKASTPVEPPAVKVPLPGVVIQPTSKTPNEPTSVKNPQPAPSIPQVTKPPLAADPKRGPVPPESRGPLSPRDPSLVQVPPPVAVAPTAAPHDLKSLTPAKALEPPTKGPVNQPPSAVVPPTSPTQQAVKPVEVPPTDLRRPATANPPAVTQAAPPVVRQPTIVSAPLPLQQLPLTGQGVTPSQPRPGAQRPCDPKVDAKACS